MTAFLIGLGIGSVASPFIVWGIKYALSKLSSQVK